MAMKILDYDGLSDFANKLNAKQKEIFMTKGEMGSPLGTDFSNPSELDTSKIYVYVGETTSTYTHGNWYFYNGTAWESGGPYNATAIVTDKTLSVSDMAADAKATGDAIDAVSDDITNIGEQLDDSGIPKKYEYTGPTYRQIDTPFSAGIPIYLRCVGGPDTDTNTTTGARFSFIRSPNPNDRIVLAELNLGEEKIIIPDEPYIGVRVIPQPYDGETVKSVVVYISQANFGVYNKLLRLTTQLDYALQPELNGVIGSSNYTDYFNDANNASLNRMFILSSTLTETMVANLPKYGNFGLLCTITGEQRNNISLQLYAGLLSPDDLYFRTSSISGSTVIWSEWTKLLNENDIAKLLYDSVISGNYSGSSSSAVWIFEYHVNSNDHYRLYVWNIAGNADGYPRLGLHKTTSGYDYLDTSKIDVNGTLYWDFTIPSEGYDYIRLYTLKDSESTNTSCTYSLIKVSGGIIDTMQSQINNATTTVMSQATNVRTCRIFKKVVCCGDSYTSGHIQLNGESAIATNEDFAWPHFMATLTGNEYVNCGRSGATVLSWVNDPRGLPKAQAAGHSQAYIIGLMINDQKTSGGVPLGTAEDIGTDSPTTYYGGMAKIVRELNAISPTAKIFICTCPMTNGNFPSYNEAVHTIVDTYKSTYPIHCLDLLANRKLYMNSSLTSDLINGHYTAIGYEQFSEILAYIWSDYINNHISEFQDVHKISYGTGTGT